MQVGQAMLYPRGASQGSCRRIDMPCLLFRLLSSSPDHLLPRVLFSYFCPSVICHVLLAESLSSPVLSMHMLRSIFLLTSMQQQSPPLLTTAHVPMSSSIPAASQGFVQASVSQFAKENGSVSRRRTLAHFSQSVLTLLPDI